MTTQPPLNPDALEAAAKAMVTHSETWDEERSHWSKEFFRGKAKLAVSAYLAAALPEVSSVDPRELNRRGWTCGCEPGNYDTCDECQSACNELAGFLNRPAVKP